MDIQVYFVKLQEMTEYLTRSRTNVIFRTGQHVHKQNSAIHFIFDYFISEYLGSYATNRGCNK